MEQKFYTIRNVRPRKPVPLPGRTLASASSPGKSEVTVTEEELLSPAVRRAIRLGRLKVCCFPSQPSSQVLEAYPHLAPPQPARRAQRVEEPPVAPEEEVEKTDTEGETKEDGLPFVSEGIDFDALRESLGTLSYRDLQALAKSDYGVSAAGKAADIIERIITKLSTDPCEE